MSKDGGQAFPRTPYLFKEAGKEYAEWRGQQGGMSYRQWLAGMALQGQLASEENEAMPSDAEPGYAEGAIARRSVRLADRLMTALEASEPADGPSEIPYF